MSGYACACGAVSTSLATHCGRPMESQPAVIQSALAVFRTTSGVQEARAAAKSGRRS
jgi:hypothetical protein